MSKTLKTSDAKPRGEPRSKSEQAQANILRAASDLFLSGGVKAISARAIAHRAGVSTMGIYSHFNGKQGILDALYIEGFELVSNALDVEPGPSPLERLMQAATQYLSVGENYEAHYRLIFGEADSGYEPSAQAKSVRLKAFNKLVEVSSRLIAPSTLSSKPSLSEPVRGGSEAPDQRQFAFEIWALLHGFVSLKHHTLGVMYASENDPTPVMWDWKESAKLALSRLASSYDIR